MYVVHESKNIFMKRMKTWQHLKDMHRKRKQKKYMIWKSIAHQVHQIQQLKIYI